MTELSPTPSHTGGGTPAAADPMRRSGPRACALAKLEYLARRQPQLRLCQILGNAVGPGDLYYTRDEDLLKALEDYDRRTT